MPLGLFIDFSHFSHCGILIFKQLRRNQAGQNASNGSAKGPLLVFLTYIQNRTRLKDFSFFRLSVNFLENFSMSPKGKTSQCLFSLIFRYFATKQMLKNLKRVPLLGFFCTRRLFKILIFCLILCVFNICPQNIFFNTV